MIRRQKGISQVIVMVIMLVMAIALPITTKLVQQSQENRSEATDFNSAAAPYYCSLTCPTGKTHKTECPTGFSESNCSAVAQPSTCPWVYTCCNCIAGSTDSTCRDFSTASGSLFCDGSRVKKYCSGNSGTSYYGGLDCATTNKTCSNGACVSTTDAECTGHANSTGFCDGTTYLRCESGKVAYRLADAAACKTSSKCSSLTNGICVNDSQCPDGAGMAIPSGGWSDCSTSKTCCDKTYIDCYADTDCGNYKICSKGACVASYAGYACTRDTQCPSTMKCLSTGKCGTATTTSTCTGGCWGSGNTDCAGVEKIRKDGIYKSSTGTCSTAGAFCCTKTNYNTVSISSAKATVSGSNVTIVVSGTGIHHVAAEEGSTYKGGVTSGATVTFGDTAGSHTYTVRACSIDTNNTIYNNTCPTSALATTTVTAVITSTTVTDACKSPGAGVTAKCTSGASCGSNTCFCFDGDLTNETNTGNSTVRTCSSISSRDTLLCQSLNRCSNGSSCGSSTCSCTGTSTSKVCKLTTTATCTEANWSSTLSPSVCPSNGQQTKTWTKVGTCTEGVSHSTETVTCTYTPPAVCSDGARQCYNTVNYQTCVNGAWGTATSCGTGKYCSGAGQCLSNSSVNTPIIIKMAFAGVKKGNAQCASNWLTEMRVRDGSGNNPLTVGAVVGSVPVPTSSVNSKGDLIYTYTTYLVEFNNGVATNGLSFFLIGPKHVSVKYGKNNQNVWYSSLAGALSVTGGTTNNYDFSEFPLLAGDVTGATAGVPDGKIDGRDFSYVKEKANAKTLVSGNAGTSVSGDIDGNCQVNSGDVRLIKQSLTEINGQTY